MLNRVQSLNISVNTSGAAKALTSPAAREENNQSLFAINAIVVLLLG